MQLEDSDKLSSQLNQNGKSQIVLQQEKQQVSDWQIQLESYIKLINRNIQRGQAVGTKGYQELNSIRSGLKSFVEERILENYETSKLSDLDQNLWQIVLYPQSQELRRKAKSVKDSGDKNEIKKVLQFSQEFFGQTIDFLIQFIQKLQLKYGSVGVLLQGQGSSSVLEQSNQDVKHEQQADVSNTVYRFLINIGDLLRYEQQINQALNNSQGKELSRAEQYYILAGQVTGHWEYGTHLNQQALISSYREDVVGSVYFYFRCLAVAHPFNSVRENLLLEFEIVRKEYKEFQQGLNKSMKYPQSPQESSSSGRSTGRSGRYSRHVTQSSSQSQQNSINVVKTFKRSFREVAVEFLCMYGMIFDHIDLDRFEEVYERSSKALLGLLGNTSYVMQLLSKSEGFQRSIFYRLCVINIYLGDKSLSETSSQNFTLGFGQMAVSVLLSLIGSLLSVWTSFKDEHGQSGLKDIVLPTFQVALQWILTKSQYVCVQEHDKQTVDSRRSFFEGCNKLLDYIYAEKTNVKNITILQSLNQQKGIRSNFALPEDRELRGFLPLKPQHQQLNFKKSLDDFQQLKQTKQGNKSYEHWYRKHIIIKNLKKLDLLLNKHRIVDKIQIIQNDQHNVNQVGFASNKQLKELEAKVIEFQQKIKVTTILEGPQYRLDNQEYEQGKNEKVEVNQGQSIVEQPIPTFDDEEEEEEEVVYKTLDTQEQIEIPKIYVTAQQQGNADVKEDKNNSFKPSLNERQNENDGAINYMNLLNQNTNLIKQTLNNRNTNGKNLGAQNQIPQQNSFSPVKNKLEDSRKVSDKQIYAGSYTPNPITNLPYSLPRPSPSFGYNSQGVINYSQQPINSHIQALPQQAPNLFSLKNVELPQKQGNGFTTINSNGFAGDKEYGNTLDGLEQTAMQAANLVLDVDGQIDGLEQKDVVSSIMANGIYQQPYISSQLPEETANVTYQADLQDPNQNINHEYSMGLLGGLQSNQNYEQVNSINGFQQSTGYSFIHNNATWKDNNIQQLQGSNRGSLSSPLVAPIYSTSSNPFAIAINSPQGYQNGQQLPASYEMFGGKSSGWTHNKLNDINSSRKNSYSRQTQQSTQRNQQHPTNPFVP